MTYLYYWPRVAAIGRPMSWLVTLALGRVPPLWQTAEIAWYKVIRDARTFDAHGDLKNDLLDYLEYQRPQSLRMPPVGEIARERRPDGEMNGPPGLVPIAFLGGKGR